MKGNEPRYSRVNRKKMRNRSNQLLNIMIGLVVLLILIVGASIIVGNSDDDGKESASEEKVLDEAGSSEEKSENEKDVSVSDSEDENGTNEQSDEESDDQGQSSTTPSDEVGGSDSSDDGAVDEGDSEIEKIVPDNDEIIAETIINPGWQPIGTDQSGEHVSEYDAESVDYNEKKKAIAYATGFSEDELFYKRVKNGGGPQKSIGIVTTKDGSKNFRVYIEWVDEKGWKPVQMDVLKTLDFEY